MRKIFYIIAIAFAVMAASSCGGGVSGINDVSQSEFLDGVLDDFASSCGGNTSRNHVESPTVFLDRSLDELEGIVKDMEECASTASLGDIDSQAKFVAISARSEDVMYVIGERADLMNKEQLRRYMTLGKRYAVAGMEYLKKMYGEDYDREEAFKKYLEDLEKTWEAAFEEDF